MHGQGAHRRAIAVGLIAAVVAACLPGGAAAAGGSCPPPLVPARQPPAQPKASPAFEQLRARLRAEQVRNAQLRKAARERAGGGAAGGRRAAAARRRAAAARRALLQRERRVRLLLEDTAAATLRFDLTRDTVDVPVVVRTTAPLPRSVRARDLRLEVPGDLHRIDGAASVPRSVAQLSAVRIGNARDRFYFTVCVDGRDLKPGTYAGTVSVSGPTRLAHVDVPVTVTVKDAGLFTLGAALALLIAIVFLAYKELRNDDKVRFAAWETARRAAAARAGGKVARAKYPRWSFFLSRQSHFGLDWLLLELLVPLAAAFSAMYAIYAANPTWGSSGLGQVIALVSTAFTAAGVRSMITAPWSGRDGQAAGADDRRTAELH